MRFFLKPHFFDLGIAALVILCCALPSGKSLAQALAPDERPFFFPDESALQISANSNPSTQNIAHLSREQLLAQPDLLTLALDSAISLEDEEALKLLVPLYAQLDEKDEILLRYGQEILARLQGDMRTAIAHLQNILSMQSNLAPVRWQLALTLANDKQFQAAQQQLRQLQNEPLPEEILQAVSHWQQQIKKAQQWQFHFHAQGLFERNINDSPAQKQVGAWRFAEAEKAYGLSYALGAEKEWELGNHWFFTSQFFANGKWFNKHEYDDVIVRAYAGLLWQDHSKQWGLLPFHERRFYAGQRYSYSSGMRWQGAWQFNPHWKWFGSYEFADNQYPERKYLTGKSQQISNTLLYQADAKQYWTLGVDLGREDTKDKSSAYDYYALRLGWGKDWAYGISSLMQAHFVRKHYQAADFLQIQREDKRYGSHISLWQRDFEWQGFTPRLSWQWKRQKSNHFAYNLAPEHRVFVEVRKDF